MLDADKIYFKKLQLEDLPLMNIWLNQSFVKEWYGRDDDSSLEAIEKKYLPRINGDQSTYCYIVYYENTPVSFIQTYKVSDEPDYAKHLDMDVEGLASIDLFIGNEDFMGKGFGSLMMKKFLRDIVLKMDDVRGCIIGPDPKNIRAIKSYEKVGFKYLKTVHIPREKEPEYIMALNF